MVHLRVKRLHNVLLHLLVVIIAQQRRGLVTGTLRQILRLLLAAAALALLFRLNSAAARSTPLIGGASLADMAGFDATRRLRLAVSADTSNTQ